MSAENKTKVETASDSPVAHQRLVGLLASGLEAAEGAQVLADLYFEQTDRDGYNNDNYCRLLDWIKDTRRALGKQPNKKSSESGPAVVCGEYLLTERTAKRLGADAEYYVDPQRIAANKLKEGKAHPSVVTLPACVKCGANAVALNQCMKCGEAQPPNDPGSRTASEGNTI